MERLTARDDKGNLLFSGKQVYAGDFYEAASCLEEYEDTGLTPEQIRELKERDTAKAAIITGYNRAIGYKVGECPTCGALSRDYMEFCSECGQRIKWEE